MEYVYRKRRLAGSVLFMGTGSQLVVLDYGLVDEDGRHSGSWWDAFNKNGWKSFADKVCGGGRYVINITMKKIDLVLRQYAGEMGTGWKSQGEGRVRHNQNPVGLRVRGKGKDEGSERCNWKKRTSEQ